MLIKVYLNDLLNFHLPRNIMKTLSLTLIPYLIYQKYILSTNKIALFSLFYNHS